MRKKWAFLLAMALLAITAIPSAVYGTSINETSEQVWTETLNRVKNAEPEDVILVDTKGSTTLSTSVIYALWGKNVDLELVFKDYSWSLYGNDIEYAPRGRTYYELRVETGGDEALLALAGDSAIVQLTLPPYGPYPYKAELIWNVGWELGGKTVYPYFYNEREGVLEPCTETEVNSYGYAAFVFEKGGKYVVTSEKLPEAETPEPTAVPTPEAEITVEFSPPPETAPSPTPWPEPVPYKPGGQRM
ncbi:MAG: hypothetical protein LBR83_00110 [Clostridiales bacterium]|jgi:hypothetical protein|nr:hypothetical protein [Clostridiales bacterium]